MTPQQKLFSLQLKKARLFSKIESMPFVRESQLLKLGKLQASIMHVEKEIVRQSRNSFED